MLCLVQQRESEAQVLSHRSEFNPILVYVGSVMEETVMEEVYLKVFQLL
jgi:hypothetical protein